MTPALTHLVLANLLLPLLQPVAGALGPLFGIGISNAEMTRLAETPVVPAGYAFGIWGPIFIATSVYGVFQALPGQRGSALLARLRGPVALALALNIAWMVTSQLVGNGWHLVAILFGIVAALATALLRLTAAEGTLTRHERWMVRPVLGVWAGWASGAAFANVSITARWAGFDWFGLSAGAAAMVVIIAATAFGAALLVRARGNAWYAGGVGWALAAIVVANLGARYDAPEVAAVAGACLALVVGLTLWLGRRPAARAPAARPAVQPAE